MSDQSHKCCKRCIHGYDCSKPAYKNYEYCPICGLPLLTTDNFLAICKFENPKQYYDPSPNARVMNLLRERARRNVERETEQANAVQDAKMAELNKVVELEEVERVELIKRLEEEIRVPSESEVVVDPVSETVLSVEEVSKTE